jgi:hypothetical protein
MQKASFSSAGGRYAVVLGRGDRPKFKSANQPTTEELAAATSDFFAANFGTWSVNEADKTLTLRYDGALGGKLGGNLAEANRADERRPV